MLVDRYLWGHMGRQCGLECKHQVEISPNYGNLKRRKIRKQAHTNGHVGFDAFDVYAKMVAIPVEFILEDVELRMHFGFVG
jgi:hypothetical protein